MMFPFVNWLESKDFTVQIIVLAVIFDAIGATAGYLAHPYLGVEPLVGVAIGLVAGSAPLSLWILRYNMKHA